MRAGSAYRPTDLAIEAIEVAADGADARAVGVAIVGTDVERIFEVVKIAQINRLVDGVAMLGIQQNVLHFGTTDTLETDRKFTGAQRFGGDAEQRAVAVAREDRGVHFNYDAEDVGSRDELRAGIGEREL